MTISGIGQGAFLTNSAGETFAPDSEGTVTLAPDDLVGLRVGVSRAEGDFNLEVTIDSEYQREQLSGTQSVHVEVADIEEAPTGYDNAPGGFHPRITVSSVSATSLYLQMKRIPMTWSVYG